MTESTCFTRNELRDYVLGGLSEEVSMAVATHVEVCDECEATVAQLDRESDTFVDALRKPAVQEEHASAYRLAAKRARSFWRDRQVAGDIAESERPTDLLRLRDYELLEPMARGGMGTVYRARHVRLNRQVAVKVLPSRWLRDQGVVARFQREMQAVGSLTHEAIVQATDGGEADGVHYLVMEMIDGLDGRALVELLGALPSADACEVVRQAALGMAYVHDQGIVHRDLKPSNVMVTRSGDVKVLDLGLARAMGQRMAEDELTTVGQLMGTLDYMAPEQLENSHTVDERADIYSLGATLYMLLAGQPPHAVEPREPIVSKLRRIAAEPPTPLCQHCPHAPDELCELVDRMLASDPSGRPATMRDIADLLLAFTEGSNLAARVDVAMEKQTQKSLQGYEQSSALSSHAEDLAKLQGREAEPKPVPESGGGGWFKWVALAIAFCFIAAGVVVSLQTPEGQLVIETSTPDVEVRVLKAGIPFKQLTLQHKANSLQLGAGEYQVEILGNSDRLEIQNGTYTLRRGETWVAKIVHRQKGENVTIAPTPDNAVPPGVPTYDGKSLDQWLALLKRERSPDQLLAACGAFDKLTSKESQHEVVAALLQAVRHHDPRTGKLLTPVFESLARIDQAAVMEGMAEELAQRNDRSTEWILFYLTSGWRRYGDGSPVSPSMSLLEQVDRAAADEGNVSRQDALDVLARMAPDDVANRRFLTVLSDTDVVLRLCAAEHLVEMKSHIPEVVSALRRVVPSGELSERAHAAWLLGDIGSAAKPALPELIAIVEDLDERVSQYFAYTVRGATSIDCSVKDAAIRAIAKIGDQSAVPVLLEEWKRRKSPAVKESVPAAWERTDRMPMASTYTPAWVADAVETLIDVRPDTITQTETGSEIVWLYKGKSIRTAFSSAFLYTRVIDPQLLYETAVRLIEHVAESERQEIRAYVKEAVSKTPYPSELIDLQVRLIELLAQSEGADWTLDPLLARWQLCVTGEFPGWQPDGRAAAVKAFHQCAERIVRADDDWKVNVVPRLLDLADREQWPAGIILLDLLSDLDEAQQAAAVTQVLHLISIKGMNHFAEYRQQLKAWIEVPGNRTAVQKQMDALETDQWVTIAMGMFRAGMVDEALKRGLLNRFAEPVTNHQSVFRAVLAVLDVLDDQPELAQLAVDLLRSPVLDKVPRSDLRVSLRAQLILLLDNLDAQDQDPFVPWLREMVATGTNKEPEAARAILKKWERE